MYFARPTIAIAKIRDYSQSMEIALKIAWIQRIRQSSDASWKVIPEYALSHLGDFAFLLDCCYDLNLLQLHGLPPFYHSVLKYWQDYRPMFSEDMTQVQNEIIWNNSNILINKRKFFSNIGIVAESYATRTYLMLTSPSYPLTNFKRNSICKSPLPQIMG